MLFRNRANTVVRWRAAADCENTRSLQSSTMPVSNLAGNLDASIKLFCYS
jgi:hypothetical protein